MSDTAADIYRRFALPLLTFAKIDEWECDTKMETGDVMLQANQKNQFQCPQNNKYIIQEIRNDTTVVSSDIYR